MPSDRKRTARTQANPRLWWGLGVLAVAAGIVLFIVLSGSGEPPSVTGSVGIEEPVRFEVESGGCGYSEVILGSGETVVPENGQFCLARLDIRNLQEPRHQLEPSCLFMVDGSGALIPPRIDAPALLTLVDLEESLGPFEFRRQSSLYYDVSKSTEMTAVELHESCGSEGVRIPAPE